MENLGKTSDKQKEVTRKKIDRDVAEDEEGTIEQLLPRNENRNNDVVGQKKMSASDRIVPESLRPQRGGESVQKRPLTLYPAANNADDIKIGMPELELGTDKKLPQKTITKPIVESKTKHTANTQLSETTFFSTLSSWKTSASYVFDSLRDKFSYFRRPRTENYSKQNAFYQASSNDTTVPVETQSNAVSRPICENIMAESPGNVIDQIRKTSPNENTLLVQNRKESAALQEAEVSSTYDNDSIQDSFEINDHFQIKEKTVLDHTTGVPQNTNRLDLKDNKKCSNGKSNEGSVSSKCVRTSMCSPCIGSKTCSKDQVLIALPTTEENIMPLPTNNSKQNDKDNVMSSSKIIYDQPSNSKNVKELRLRFSDDVNENETVTNQNKSDTPTRSRLMTIPDVKLHSATPTCSVNQELNLQTSLSEDDISKEDSDSMAELLQLSKTPEQLTISEKKFDSACETEAKNSDDLGETQFSINLWNLRNSLEQSSIELQCPVRGFDDYEGNSDDRRLSLATDGMTEASPLSTPSSEFTNYRGKSISDSEDDGRAYFITPSGRISPRQPNYPQRSITSFCSSPDRNSNEAIPRTDCCFLPVESTISSRNLSDPSDLISSVSQRNILVTQATIEGQNRNPDDDNPSNFTRKILEESAIGSSTSTCEEKRNKFYLSPKWSTVSDSDDILEEASGVKPGQGTKNSGKSASLHLLRQASLPLPTERTLMHLPDRIEEQPHQHHHYMKTINDAQNRTKLFKPRHITSQSLNRKADCGRGRLLRSSNSISSDEVFLNDSQSTANPTNSTNRNAANYRNMKYESPQTSSLRHQNLVRNPQNFSAYSTANSDTSLIPPTNKVKQQQKFRSKLGSATSSGTSSPTSPPSSASEKPILRCVKSVDLESDDSIGSRTSSSRSSSSIKSLTKIFRRSNRHRQRSDSVPTFCGYSMERDYCIDLQTDRVFKEFLRESSPTSSSPSLLLGEPLPPPSHMVPPPPLKNTSSTQLRRQVMRKQYSDSIAMYYGQQQRRWRFTKQKSDSVNCPVDRAIFRRQDRIDEEFDPEEINERLSSTSSHRDTERQTEYILPTVCELREWRRSSEDRSRILRHASSLPTATFEGEPTTGRSTRRVTFEQSQLANPKSRRDNVGKT